MAGAFSFLLSAPSLCPSRNFSAQLHFTLDPRQWTPHAQTKILLTEVTTGSRLAEQIWPVSAVVCEMFK